MRFENSTRVCRSRQFHSHSHSPPIVPAYVALSIPHVLRVTVLCNGRVVNPRPESCLTKAQQYTKCFSLNIC